MDLLYLIYLNILYVLEIIDNIFITAIKINFFVKYVLHNKK